MEQAQIHPIANVLTPRFYERAEVIEGLEIAAITGEHAFLLGPPGTAKSELCRGFSATIGASYFEWLLTRFSTPEEIFGPPDLNLLKQGEFSRITKGKLPEAEIGFLDEIWKANSAILNALLTLVNERIFHNNGIAVPVPLRTLVSASNEIPEDESLRALYDRFLLRFQTGYLGADSFKELVCGSPGGPISQVTDIEHLQVIQTAANLVSLPPDFGEMFLQIRNDLGKEGIVPSDRRFHRAVKLVKAKAILQNRNQVETEDLEILQHCLWDTPEQRNQVKKVVLRAANPGLIKALEIKESCEEAALAAFSASDEEKMQKAVEAGGRIKAALVQLEKLGNGKVTTIREEVQALQKRIIKECMGLSM